MKRLAIVFALLLAPAMARAQTAAGGSTDPAPLPATPTPAARIAPALEAPPPSEESPPSTTPDEEVPRGFSAKLWGGPAYRRIYGVGILGGDLGLALGSQRGHLAVYGGASLLLGRTELGLGTKQVQTMGSLEGRFGRLRIGGGVHLTYLAVQRVTKTRVFDQFGGGLSLLGSVDLARTDDGHALYLGGEIGGDFLFALLSNTTPFVWGPTLALGVRY